MPRTFLAGHRRFLDELPGRQHLTKPVLHVVGRDRRPVVKTPAKPRYHVVGIKGNYDRETIVICRDRKAARRLAKVYAGKLEEYRSVHVEQHWEKVKP